MQKGLLLFHRTSNRRNSPLPRVALIVGMAEAQRPLQNFPNAQSSRSKYTLPTLTKLVVPIAGTYCGLCGKQGRLTRTDCCNRRICDDHGLYRLFTYSRVSCARNHERYTVCSTHWREHPEETSNWRDCAKCREFYGDDDLETYVGQSTSNCNFAEDEWKPPEFEKTYCADCKRLIKMNCDGYSGGPKGKRCEDCSQKAMADIRPQRRA